MRHFTRTDELSFQAAVGWLELGNWREANEELENITPRLRAHPDVLRVRWGVFAKAKKWELAAEIAQALCKMIPGEAFGWVHLRGRCGPALGCAWAEARQAK